MGAGGTPTQTQNGEKRAAWALAPIAATVGYYSLPLSLQEDPIVQFSPQLVAYLGFIYWASGNTTILPRLGLGRAAIWIGCRWGLMTGLILGGLNTLVILLFFPSMGYDITFLKTTPHGQVPPLAMVPWFIGFIAVAVEINFRGFLLGRLATIESRWQRSPAIQRILPLSLLASTLTFAFDPFLVNTFRHLHWIAVWDGLIWGTIRLRTGNLYTTIVAHGVEVTIMYLAVKAAIG